MLEVGHDGGPSLGEDPKEGRRGLTGRGVAQVDDDVRGLDGERKLLEREPPGDDAPLGHSQLLESFGQACALGHRAGEEEPDPRVRRRGPRDGARHRLDPLLRCEQPEAAHDHVVFVEPELPPALSHRPGVDRGRRRGHGETSHPGPRHLRPHRVRREGAVDAHEP